MHIRYFTIIAILLLGITGSVWYAQNERASEATESIVSGYVTTSGAEGDLVVPAPALPATPPASTDASEQFPASHECERASLVVGSASYAPCGTGATLIEVMRGLASEGLTFTGKEHTGLGYFVESINGTVADRGLYWSLYKNGEYSEFGVSEARVGPGDEFEWKLEKSY